MPMFAALTGYVRAVNPIAGTRAHRALLDLQQQTRYTTNRMMAGVSQCFDFEVCECVCDSWHDIHLNVSLKSVYTDDKR